MTVTVKHSKTNAISDWTQAQLDEQIALGNFPAGTTLANIVLPSDWNNDHTLTGVGTMAEQNANSVAITGGSVNGTTIGATTASTGKFTSVTTPSVTATSTDLTLSAISTGNVNLTTLGGTQFKAIEATGSVNIWNVRGGDGSTTSPRFTTEGTGTNIAGQFNTKGTGALQFFSGNTEQMRITNTASAVNYVQVTGAATGGFVAISAQGSDSNPGIYYTTKGFGSHRFTTNTGGGSEQFRIITNSASTVNFLQVNGSATTLAPQFSAQGSDTNISMAFQPKGTGAIDLAAGSSGVNISNGGTVTALTRTAGGSGYTTALTATISAPTTAGGVQATANAYAGAITTVITSGGTGYTLNDVITVVGGTGIQSQSYTVTGVTAGVITALTVQNYGQYTAIPSSPVSTTGGTGTGASLTLSNWSLTAIAIATAGSGYIEQPTITFSGGGGSGASAYAHVGSQSIIRTLASPLSLFVPGGEAFRVSDGGATSAAYWNVFSGSTSPILRAVGSASGVIQTGSAVPIQFTTNASTSSTEQLRVAHTASAVNYVQVTGAATGAIPAITAQGSDANTPLGIWSKNTGSIFFYTSGGSAQFEVSATASAVNRLQATGAIAGASPKLNAVGSDTNIDLALTPKGTGRVKFGTYTANMALTIQGYIEILDSGGTIRKLAVIA